MKFSQKLTIISLALLGMTSLSGNAAFAAPQFQASQKVVVMKFEKYYSRIPTPTEPRYVVTIKQDSRAETQCFASVLETLNNQDGAANGTVRYMQSNPEDRSSKISIATYDIVNGSRLRDPRSVYLSNEGLNCRSLGAYDGSRTMVGAEGAGIRGYEIYKMDEILDVEQTSNPNGDCVQPRITYFDAFSDDADLTERSVFLSPRVMRSGDRLTVSPRHVGDLSSARRKSSTDVVGWKTTLVSSTACR